MHLNQTINRCKWKVFLRTGVFWSEHLRCFFFFVKWYKMTNWSFVFTSPTAFGDKSVVSNKYLGTWTPADIKTFFGGKRNGFNVRPHPILHVNYYTRVTLIKNLFPFWWLFLLKCWKLKDCRGFTGNNNKRMK